MSDSNSGTTSGIGFTGALLLLFIALKLLGHRRKLAERGPRVTVEPDCPPEHWPSE